MNDKLNEFDIRLKDVLGSFLTAFREGDYNAAELLLEKLNVMLEESDDSSFPEVFISDVSINVRNYFKAGYVIRQQRIDQDWIVDYLEDLYDKIPRVSE